LLAELEVRERLFAAARAAGLRPPEAHATISSGLRSGKQRPVDLEHHQRLTRSVPSLPLEAFAAIADRLAELCPLDEQPDVSGYLASRRLELGAADAFALPASLEQKAVVVALAQEFGREALAQSGLIKRLPAGEPDLSRFVWPEHRLCVTWRGPEGIAHHRAPLHGEPRGGATLGVPEAARRGVAAGMAPARASGGGATRRDVEGPSDYFAVRAWAFVRARAGAQPMPVTLALPSATKLRPEWLRPLMDRRVVVALDSDDAGDQASVHILEQLSAVGIQAERSRPPAPAKDWAAAWLRACARSKRRPAVEGRACG
jgi:hypothetical protein